MTKQEAISYLVAMKGENKFVNPYREEALSMATAALQEQENLLSAFLAPIDCYNGLKRKFLIFKSDTGEMIENCFVLRPDKDPAAVEALRAYASATDNETLAKDIYNWVGKGVTVQQWIPQTEVPWMGEEIAKLCIRYMEEYADFHGYASSKKVKAHVVRLLELEKCGRIAILPQPPKGE